jgi:hypothetical protein
MGARLQPRWERVQRARGAAAYAGYQSERNFLAAVHDGVMPPPFDHCGAPAWDIVDLDASIDAMKAGAVAKRRWQERAPDRV